MSSDATARDVNLELRQAVFEGDLDAVRRCLDDGGSVTATFTISNLPFLENNQLYRFRYPMGELGDPMTVLTLWLKSGRRPWGQDGRYKPQSATRIAILRLLLERGADASDGTDVRLAGAREFDRAESPLYHACMAGDLAAARLLLDHGADADGSHDSLCSYRPILAAASRNHVDVLRLLIDRGAGLGRYPHRSEPRYGGTPLGTASLRGHVEVARLLLDHGADVNLANSQGSWQTPLCLALQNASPSMVRLLLARGADTERAPDASPMRPVTLARIRGYSTLLQCPSRAAHINAAFDLLFLARCVVAGQRAAHRGSERQRVWFDRNLVKVIATYLVVKTPLERAPLS